MDELLLSSKTFHWLHCRDLKIRYSEICCCTFCTFAKPPLKLGQGWVIYIPTLCMYITTYPCPVLDIGKPDLCQWKGFLKKKWLGLVIVSGRVKTLYRKLRMRLARVEFINLCGHNLSRHIRSYDFVEFMFTIDSVSYRVTNSGIFLCMQV